MQVIGLILYFIFPVILGLYYGFKANKNRLMLFFLCLVYCVSQFILFFVTMFKYGGFGHTNESNVSIFTQLLLSVWFLSPILISVYFGFLIYKKHKKMKLKEKNLTKRST